MNKTCTAAAKEMTAWILGGLSFALTSSIALWYLGDSTQFIEHRLGLNTEAFNNPIAWLLSLEFSMITQILASGIIFGVAHGAWIFFRGEFKIAIPVILSTTILGVLLAILYIVSGSNILAPIVAHTIINLFIELWLILSAVSSSWDDEKEEDQLIT